MKSKFLLFKANIEPAVGFFVYFKLNTEIELLLGVDMERQTFIWIFQHSSNNGKTKYWSEFG